MMLKTSVVNPTQSCFCGCGAQTSATVTMFKQGHDAILKSKLIRVQRNEIPATELPKILGHVCVDRPGFAVVGFNAATILKMFAKR